MRLTRREAEDALALANVQAFLRVIRQGESSQAEAAYRRRYHPTQIVYFDDLSQHPRIFETTPDGRRSSAAGAYQITATTWDDVAPQLGLTDFSPRSQDIAAVALIARRGALAPLLAGDFDDAVLRCRLEWTSLPGAAENRAGWTLAAARALYQSLAGTLGAAAPSDTQPAAPIEERGVPYQEADMPLPLLALISTFGPMIAQMIPQVAKLFAKPESPTATRNVEAIQLVFDTIQKATSQTNLQAAVEAMQADPSVREVAAKAVVTEPAIMAVLEIGAGGIQVAREANAATIAAADKWWKLVLNPVLLVTLMVLPLVYIIVMELVRYMEKVSADVIAQTIGTVIGLVLGGIMGFWMGQTYQQSNRRSSDQGGISNSTRDA